MRTPALAQGTARAPLMGIGFPRPLCNVFLWSLWHLPWTLGFLWPCPLGSLGSPNGPLYFFLLVRQSSHKVSSQIADRTFIHHGLEAALSYAAAAAGATSTKGIQDAAAAASSTSTCTSEAAAAASSTSDNGTKGRREGKAAGPQE